MTKLFIKLFMLVVLIALGLFIGPKLIGEKGYVLITLGTWKVEMTVISAAILLFGSYFLVWLVLKLISTLMAITGISANWFSQFSSRHKKQRFFQGMLAYSSNQFELAQKQLKGLAGTEWYGLDWLALADIAEHQGDQVQQAEHLLAAFKLSASRVVALQRLNDLYKEQGQQEKILSLLNDLDDKERKHPVSILVEADLLATQGQWQVLQERLPSWKKSLPKERFEQLNKEAVLGGYAEIASKKGANELKNHWRMAARKHKKDIAHQFAYIELLIEQGMHVEAENELLNLQSKQASATLLPLFKRLKLQNPTKTLQRLESWLKQDDNNLQLLDVIATVAFNAGDLELAEKVLRKRLVLQPDKHSKLLLAKIKCKQTDLQSAVELYQQIT
ncbi:MAG: heme biosynthesis HemY N-terminal domain-containing protein [Aestuariibacter sp.]